MTKLDQAIEAMSTLPEAQRDELADVVLELATSMTASGTSALTPEQWEEVRRRIARGFRPAEASRLYEVLARYG